MTIRARSFIFAFVVVAAVAATSSVLSVSTAAPSPSTIPSRVTSCWNHGSSGGGDTSFCNLLQVNTTEAVQQKLAANIGAGVAVFSTSSSSSRSSKKKVPPRLLSKLDSGAMNFPGWQAAEKGAIISTGRYTYDSWSSEIDDSISQYDMASCSKIMGTTTATAQLYQMGLLGLDDKVASEKLLGPSFAQKGKGEITVRNLLLHNAGYPPDPTPYWYSSKNFPCKNNQRYHPTQNFDCVETIYQSLMTQTLQYPTGSQYVYSDISMITLMWVVAKVVVDNNLVSYPADYPNVCRIKPTPRNCHFYAYVDKHIFKRYGLSSTVYIPDNALKTPPEWWSSDFRHEQIMGWVSDENAFALGGISGHAGVFSTVRDVMKFLSVWVNDQDPAMLNRTTVELFTTVKNLTQSNRALGWQTNFPETKAKGGPSVCGSMPHNTFYHEGFTGTLICANLDGTIVALLSNARYPDKNVDGMIQYRPAFTSLVQKLLK